MVIPFTPQNSTANISPSQHRHFEIKLCRINVKQVGLKIISVITKCEVEVDQLSNVEKKLLKESILEKTFYYEALKVFLKSDCTYVRRQLDIIFMGKMPDELAKIVGAIRPVVGPTNAHARPNFYNERIDDDIEIIN
jgi:hypothetical protein